MSLEKTTEAIKSAMKYLEGTMKNLSKDNEDDVSGFVWQAAADLEYALFLFSVTHQDDPESSSWKLSLRSKDVEIDSVLASTRDMLKEAEGKIETGKVREAHKKTWMARGYLLKLQEFFEKRRKLKQAAKK